MLLGIDIGGTTIHFGLLEGSELVGKHTVPSFGHGWGLQQTLDYLQSLYEKKLVTYPRTDSRFLTDDMEDGVKASLELVFDKR